MQKQLGWIVSKVLTPFQVAFLILKAILDTVLNPEIARVAFRNLAHQRVRSNLTLLGIVIGIAAIVALFSIGQSLNASIEQQFQSLGLNNIFVEPGGGDFASTAFSRVPKEDVGIIEQIPGVKQVIPFYETSAIAKKANQEASLFLIGVEASELEYLKQIGYLNLSEGRVFGENETFSLIVFDNFLKNAYSDELSLRESVEMNGKKFKIVGVSTQADSTFGSFGFFDIGFVHKRALETVFNETEPTELAVEVFSRDLVPQVARRIEQRLEREHGEKKITVLTSEGLLETAFSVLGVVQVFVLAITAIALLVGGIGIMNTMFMAVLERTREIGTMKAIGADNNLVRALFLAEAGILGAVGGLLGVLLGFALAFVATAIATASGFPLQTMFSLELALGAVLFSFALGLVAGLAPAEQAIRLDPVEAIRYE